MNGRRKHKDINHIVDDTEKDTIMNEIETSNRVKKENTDLQKENCEQKRKIIELEKELVEWNEFKKIRDAQMQALRKQMP